MADKPTAYTTVDGDMLDAICIRHYGRHPGTVEAVVDANPTLANQPPVLSAGITITLPALPLERRSIRLF